MLHPSYSDLMEVVNSEVEPGEQPLVQSRYSIVLATAKRARQVIAGKEAFVNSKNKKPLSVAVEELHKSKIKILGEEEAMELEAELAAREAKQNEQANVEENVETAEEAVQEAAVEE